MEIRCKKYLVITLFTRFLPTFSDISSPRDRGGTRPTTGTSLFQVPDPGSSTDASKVQPGKRTTLLELLGTREQGQGSSTGASKAPSSNDDSTELEETAAVHGSQEQGKRPWRTLKVIANILFSTLTFPVRNISGLFGKSCYRYQS